MTGWQEAQDRGTILLAEIEAAMIHRKALVAVVLAYDLHQVLKDVLQEEMKAELEKVIGHE